MSGGISTKTTCSASRESSPSFVTLLTSAIANAMPAPAAAATTSRSSSAASVYLGT